MRDNNSNGGQNANAGGALEGGFRFELGQNVRDKITGATGIVMGRAEMLGDSPQYWIQSTVLKDGCPASPFLLNDSRLEVHNEPLAAKGASAGRRAGKAAEALTGAGAGR